AAGGPRQGEAGPRRPQEPGEVRLDRLGLLYVAPGHTMVASVEGWLRQQGQDARCWAARRRPEGRSGFARSGWGQGEAAARADAGGWSSAPSLREPTSPRCRPAG